VDVVVIENRSQDRLDREGPVAQPGKQRRMLGVQRLIVESRAVPEFPDLAQDLGEFAVDDACVPAQVGIRRDATRRWNRRQRSSRSTVTS